MSVATGQRREHQEYAVSGVGVLDKASTLLSVVERGPATLVELVASSGLPRPTVHRLALALERLGLLARDTHGRFVLGARLGNLTVGTRRDRLTQFAEPVLGELHGATGFDARLFRRNGGLQVCLAGAVADSRADPVPVGTSRPAKAGPVAQVLLAWEDPDALHQGLHGAHFTVAQLGQVRRQGWAQGPDSTSPGRFTVAVPIREGVDRVTAALTLSGPQEGMSPERCRRMRSLAIDAAVTLGDAARRGAAGRAPARTR
ncbi:IclR family transcriptional regulator [Streptomyces sp. NPDC050504]|uniref:IclR family transcriptional regulator n=1 Tax=Streptomyces sp. NPDC050504 TaxID=3365618 RepID=UPI00379CB213